MGDIGVGGAAPVGRRPHATTRTIGPFLFLTTKKEEGGNQAQMGGRAGIRWTRGRSRRPKLGEIDPLTTWRPPPYMITA